MKIICIPPTTSFSLTFHLSFFKVRYLVVGGYAVAFHGHPRYTQDIDIWVEMNPENAAQVAKALDQYWIRRSAMSTDLKRFNARYISTFMPDRLYRVYLTDDQIFFIRIGGQAVLPPGSAGAFGLLGLLEALILIPATKRAEQKLQSRIEEFDRSPPSLLLPKHKHNFSAIVSDFTETSLETPSALSAHGTHFGRWIFTLRGKKPMTVQFEKLEEMHAAFKSLPGVLGSRLTVNVEWDKGRQRFVKPRR